MNFIPRMGFALLLTLFAMGAVTQAAATEDAQPGSAAAIKQETQDLVQQIKTYSLEQRQEAVAAAKDGLDSIDQRIDALQARVSDKWDDMSQAAQEQAKASMDGLREQRAQVAEWYDNLKDSSDDAWEQTKEGFSEAYETLTDTWDDVAEAFDS